MPRKDLELMIVAGEASGDRLGAELAEAIRSKSPRSSFFGATGPLMRSAGVESVMESDSWSVVGIGAVLRTVPKFLKILATLSRTANKRRPDAVVLIDFPEFNLKLARRLKRNGHKVIYYVSPQVWAWRKYRSRTIQNSVDLLMSILPFEMEWYKAKGIKHVKFVGNPVASRSTVTLSKEAFCDRHMLDARSPIVALLPGSRRKEIERHLGLMTEAATLLKLDNPAIQFLAAAADSSHARIIENALSSVPEAKVIAGETLDLLNAADAAAISSGTATLEAGIIGTPMVVVYKLPKLDYVLFRPFVKVPHIALVNLIAGRRIAPELIQKEFTAERLRDELTHILSPRENARVRMELKAVADLLGRDNSSLRAADAVVEFLENTK
jgi:lipid-A-disaccharide synthase